MLRFDNLSATCLRVTDIGHLSCSVWEPDWSKDGLGSEEKLTKGQVVAQVKGFKVSSLIVK